MSPTAVRAFLQPQGTPAMIGASGTSELRSLASSPDLRFVCAESLFARRQSFESLAGLLEPFALTHHLGPILAQPRFQLESARWHSLIEDGDALKQLGQQGG